MTEQLKPEFIMGGNGIYAGIDEDDAAEINFPCMLISLPNEGDFAKMRAVLESWNTRADGWISVEDELPQEDFQVLACCDDDIEACIFRMHDTGNYYFERVDGDFRLEATHWMPLPIPPVKDLK